MIFFTSDTHFWHKNILKYCPRPYKDVEAMNEGLINNWNADVGEDDEVYHLGDFAFGTVPQICDILKRLNGKKYLIRGNHDKVMEKKGGPNRLWNSPKVWFQWVKDYHELEVKDEEMDVVQKIILCHYPFQVWNHSHHGSWHLHGHCHGTLPSKDSMSRLDVGVDQRWMRPISYEGIKAIMTRKVFKPVDHHGDKGRTAS